MATSNYTSYTTVYGTNSKDSIYNSASTHHVTISAGAGNDTIRNLGDTVSIAGGSGNDFIYSYSYYSTIDGDSGNDKISLNSSGHHNVIRYCSGEGNDTIYNLTATDTISIASGTYTRSTVGNNVILKVGTGSITLRKAKGKTINIKGTLAGGKTINNTKNKKKLSGTSYADTITNSGSRVTISGGKGNDSITNTGSRVSINSGEGNDWIFNEIVGNAAAGSYNTISTGEGKDTLSNDGANALILTGTGNDSILNYGANTKINAGDGNDKIINQSNDHDYGDYVSIKGGAGKDTIWNNGGEYLTITGGTGDDSIINSGAKNLYTYAKGDGNDTLWGFSSSDTVRITGAKYTRSTVGSDVVLKVGTGSITLKDAAYTTINIRGTLQGGSSTSNRDIKNYTSYKTINGTGYADTITNYGSNVKIYGNAGSDTVVNTADSCTLDSGNGRDEIYNLGKYSKIVGGSDADFIFNGYNEDTLAVYGGLTVSIDEDAGNYSTISSGAGNDTILNFGNRVSVNGNEDDDIIINGYYYDDRGKYSTLDGGSGNDSIANLTDNATINGDKGDDEIVLNYSGFYSYYNVVQYNYGDGNDSIWGYNSTDTLNITGGYYSRSTVGNDVVVKVGSGSITLVDARYRTINIETATSSYNVADDWISEDDNNFSTSANLSSIVDNGAANYSVAELDSNLTSLTTKSNLIAYSGKK